RDVRAEFHEAVYRPRREGAREPPLRNAVALFDLLAKGDGIEQAERTLEDRPYLLAGLEHVNRLFFHQLLQPLGEQRFAAAGRAEEVEHLLALFDPLCRVAD